MNLQIYRRNADPGEKKKSTKEKTLEKPANVHWQMI